MAASRTDVGSACKHQPPGQLYLHTPTLPPPLLPSSAAPLEAEQARATHPLQESELGTLVARVKAAAQQERLPPPPPMLRAGLPPRPPRASAAKPAVVTPGGKVKPSPGYELPTTRGRQTKPTFSTCSGGGDASAGQPGASVVAPTPAVRVALPASQPPPARLQGMRCSCCGLTQHSSDDCPLAIVSG